MIWTINIATIKIQGIMLYVNLSEVLRDLVKTKGKWKLLFSLHSFSIIGKTFSLGPKICYCLHWIICKHPLNGRYSYIGLGKKKSHYWGKCVQSCYKGSVEVYFVHQGWMWQVANKPSLTKEGEKQSSAFISSRWNKLLRPPIRGSSVLNICSNFGYLAPCRWRLSCLPLFNT